MDKIAKTLIFVIILLHGFDMHLSRGQLKVGFYSKTCPNAEPIVQSVVKEATNADSRTPPVLLRLLFHDCFVDGCDGSILVDNERDAPEHAGVGGFDQINGAKELIEAQCPGVVSCADIVVMAAKEAVVLAGGPAFEVETGRRDGKVSMASHAAGLPDVNDPIELLKSKFRSKGLSEQDLAILTGGGHTIGTTACFFMPERLYNFNGTQGSDPSINPKILKFLKSVCPENGDVNTRLPLDLVTADRFDDRAFHNIKNGRAVLASDARLLDDRATKKVVDSYVGKFHEKFARDFAVAMVKMGRIGVKTGREGQIRRVCDAIN